ncbi:MAG: B12-binding domain-containing radical SAM protein [Candidatus Heimdallarchaeota archaeon]
MRLHSCVLKQHNISVDLVDCTFLTQKKALEKIWRSNSKVIGIYSMFSMKESTIQLAKILREDCELLVTGGPLPTSSPKDFLQNFDVVVIGEGEETMLDLVQSVENNSNLSRVKGIIYKEKGKIKRTPPREFIQNLDNIPFPARGLLDNLAYKDQYAKKFGYTITSMLTSRGCPFNCDFCSRPVFGNHFRIRSAANIVDEMEMVLALRYDRIWFVDDCFTINRERIIGICNEIIRRGVKIDWECLSRVDTIDKELANKMKKAGCVRVFYGIESGNNSILALMNKQITIK